MPGTRRPAFATPVQLSGPICCDENRYPRQILQLQFRMISVEYCQLLARYNHWMNERLYAVISEFSAEERNRDRGAFFG